MSKGISHLFNGTSGAGKELILQVQQEGYKISPNEVMMITKTGTGKIIWLETGNKHAGYEHIINNHEKEFNGKGISNEEIPNFILEAVYQGNVVGTQGKRNPREIYEFTYKGKKQYIAVQVSDNGYIVSANLKSAEEMSK